MHYNNWRRVARRAAIVFYHKTLDNLDSLEHLEHLEHLEYLETLVNLEPKFCISLNLH